MTPSTPSDLLFGLAVPMFAAPGIPDLRTPTLERLDCAQTLEAIQTAESLGFDSAWFSDHLFHGRDGEFLESWTTLAAAAGMTTRLRLVNNHLGTGFRAAPLIAKMSATADVISNGRFELFVSHGLREREHTSYGFPWEPDTTLRVARLAEAVSLIRALWQGRPVDFDGRFHRLRGAISAPGPAHDVPIWIGGPLDDAVVTLVAEQADGWNALPASLEEYREQARRVDDACRRSGRDPSTLRRSLETQVLILDENSTWDGWMAHWEQLRRRAPLGGATSDLSPLGTRIRDVEAAREAWFDSFVIGSVDEVTDKLGSYRDLGVDEVVCWFMDWPTGASMQTMAESVVPLLRRG